MKWQRFSYNVVIPWSILFNSISKLMAPLCNLSIFLLCVWKLCEVYVSKHRILQLNCLFNNINVVIPRSILFHSISMLKTNTLVQFEPIPSYYVKHHLRCSKPDFWVFGRFFDPKPSLSLSKKIRNAVTT